MTQAQQTCFADLEAKLAEMASSGSGSELSDRQLKAVEQVFDSEIFSVLTPMAVRAGGDFPLLINNMLHVCAQLKPDATSDGKPRFAIIPLGRTLARFLTLGADRGYAFVLLEDVVCKLIDRFFPGEVVVGSTPFRMTRNADFALRDDLATDLLAGMEGVLSARKHGDCRAAGDCRLGQQRDARIPHAVAAGRARRHLLDDRSDRPGGLLHVADLTGFDALKYEPWPPQRSPDLEPGAKILETVARRDVLLVHPFQSFEPVQKLVEEAAADPDVLAIKQILYRTSKKSPIVAALAKAAQRGKYVTVIVELKARFDEARNIEWGPQPRRKRRPGHLWRERAENACQNLHHRPPRAARHRPLCPFWHRQLQRDHGPDLQ